MLTSNSPTDRESRDSADRPRDVPDPGVPQHPGRSGHEPANPRILVVDHTLGEAYAAVTPLSSAGFSVTVSRTFDAAKALLAAGEYGLLIAALRLGNYNGLHLVVRARAMSEWLPAIVTAEAEDTVLRADAERLSATYVVLPVPAREFLAAVIRTYVRRPAEAALRPPFERRTADRRATASNGDQGDQRRAERRVVLIRQAMRGSASS